MTDTLVSAFLLGRKATKTPPGLTEALLTTHLARGKEVWPRFRVDPHDFAQFLGERFAHDELDEAPVADLYLAHAALAHDSAAVTELELRLRRECERIEQRHRGSVNAVDLTLDLQSRLLVGETPRLVEYSGRGSLGGWLAATAVRAGLNARREGDRRRKREVVADVATPPLADPELEVLRNNSRGVFNEVFREVLLGLDPKERALLRLHVVEGMGLDRIARVQDIGRSTAARWLSAIRAKLLKETRRLLAERLSIGASTLDDLLPVLTGDLDLSIRKVLSKT